MQEVKLQNNMKDEEIKALRNRMVKMESIIPVQVGSAHTSARLRPLCSDHLLLQDDDRNSEEGEPPLNNGCGFEDGTHEPEVRVQQLMDQDPVFRRGRLRWLKQEQQRILNLQQQNISKKLRGQNQNQNQGQGQNQNQCQNQGQNQCQSQSQSQGQWLRLRLAPVQHVHSLMCAAPPPTGHSPPLVPVHLPGTGRFIPPLERKLKFPFKSNPAHRLSWGPASAALQALGLEEGGAKEPRAEQGGAAEGPASSLPPPPPALLPLPFQAPPPRMRTPSPHRPWQQRNQGGGFHQHRPRRNSLDSSAYGGEQRQGGGHQGRPRQRRGLSPGPGGGRDRDGPFPYHQPQHLQFHPHPYYNPHNAPFHLGPHPPYHSLPCAGAPPPPADILFGVGPPQGGWGFTTPPRMRRQFSVPDLKSRDTPI